MLPCSLKNFGGLRDIFHPNQRMTLISKNTSLAFLDLYGVQPEVILRGILTQLVISLSNSAELAFFSGVGLFWP